MDPREISLFLDSTSDGILGIDRFERLTLVNAAAERILSIRSDEALGRPVREVLPVTRLPEVLASGEAELDQTLTWGAVTIVTSRHPVRDASGVVLGAVAVFRDITEIRRLAEEVTNLQETRLLNEAIFESTQDAISVVNEEGLNVMVNPAYTRVTGFQPAEVIGQHCSVDISSGESIHLRVIRTGRPVRNERLKVGRYARDVVVDANPIVVRGAIKGSVAVIKDVSELHRLHDQLADARARIRTLEARYTFDDVIGRSEVLKDAVSRARAAAGTPASIILTGESGTGKELFAHAIHNASERRNARFVRVNCAALAQSVLESELFGYVAGAFTGASKGGRRGLFEEAHGGTIFLDEIALMAQDTQAKLLRVLQEHEIRRVGGSETIPVNVRVIAATNLDLRREVRDGRFREDLYYRLQVVPIALPPLRERPEDITMLAQFFVQKINGEYGRVVREIEAPAMERLRGYSWPGNIRELENVLRRAMVSVDLHEATILLRHLPVLEGNGCDGGADDGDAATPMVPAEPPSAGSLRDAVAHTEAVVIRQALHRNGGNRTVTARALGISLRALQYKMKAHRLQ